MKWKDKRQYEIAFKIVKDRDIYIKNDKVDPDLVADDFHISNRDARIIKKKVEYILLEMKKQDSWANHISKEKRQLMAKGELDPDEYPNKFYPLYDEDQVDPKVFQENKWDEIQWLKDNPDFEALYLHRLKNGSDLVSKKKKKYLVEKYDLDLSE